TSCSPWTKRRMARSAATRAVSPFSRAFPRNNMRPYDSFWAVIQTGLARVLSGDAPVLRGKRLGLLVNPTAVDAGLRHIVDALHGAPEVELCCLFGPEHGVRGDAQDMASVDTARDSVTGLPMHSLYGRGEASLRPRPDTLAGLDAVVYDIQDVGSRYYTFVWTLLHMMEACAGAGVEVIGLAR